MEQAIRIPVTETTSRPEAVDARSLASRSRAELDAIFAALPAPDLAELRGDLRGSLMGVLGVDRLPSWLRDGIYAVLRTPLNVWRTKRFAGDRGVNRWGVGDGQLSFAAYRVKLTVALDGTGPCAQLDYDVDENLLPLRGIIGEVRRLGPGLLLARMNYRAGSAHACVLYFTLEH